jgi:hypothetical protein
MFFPRRGMCARAAAVVGFILVFAGLLPPQTASASQSFSLFILFETPVLYAPCSNITVDAGTAAVDASVLETLPKIDCEAPAHDTFAHEAAPRESALLHTAGPVPAAPTPVLRTATKINGCLNADSSAVGCRSYDEQVKSELATLGKDGQKLLRARERVLEILGETNSCSAWFQSLDRDSLETFRTLSFFIDRKGINYIAEVRQNGSDSLLFNPYVASVIQAGGSYQTVTVNAEGAFFQAQTAVLEQPKDGGPPRLRGPHLLQVGPYLGGTPSAQVVTLLHELGHLVGLLPHDQGDVDGKSVQNTREVLKFCRAEIESQPKRGAFSASR